MELDYPMPSGMTTYAMPQIPEPDEIEGVEAGIALLEEIQEELAGYRAGQPAVVLALDDLDQPDTELINQVLGSGEVSMKYHGAVDARIQESVLAGVWRTFFFDSDDRVVCDLLEVADVPGVVGFAAESAGAVDVSSEGVGPELANALPILVELQSQHEKYTNGGEPHSINLTLLPLSEPELEFIDQRLGRGPIDVLSRAYGKCEVISTQTAGIWWVRYYNSMSVLILNTLEVVDVPVVIKAAPEDLADSAERLKEILEPYWSEVA